jgi:hypothetical protein
MTEMNKAVRNKNDEIDLILVLDKILRFLGNNKSELIAAVVVGIFCAYTIYKLLPRSYSSALILHSQVLTNSEEIELIENWNILLNNDELKILSKNLNCDPSLLSKVKRFNASNIQISQPSSGFIVEVLVKDTSILPDLQKSIIYGLENNDYVREKVELKRNNTIKIIDNLHQEIAKLDSTKKKIESSGYGRASGQSSIILDISNLNSVMISLNEKLYEYEDVLKFVDAIQVLQNFEKYEKPASPRLSSFLISGFLGGLFIGLSVGIIKYIKSKLALVNKSSSSQYSDKVLA